MPFIPNFIAFYSRKNRWWAPIALGLFFSICFAPFDPGTHPLLFPFPFFGFIVLIPLFVFASQANRRRALWHSYLFGVAACISQYYWVSFVLAEGLWPLIAAGTVLLCLYLGLYFLLAAMAFRFAKRHFPVWYPAIVPAFWVCLEWARGSGELSFPWNFMGYTLTPVLPVAQLASICGVFGLSYLVVLGNLLLFDWLREWQSSGAWRNRRFPRVIAFVIALAGAGLWGLFRCSGQLPRNGSMKISLIQTHFNQNQWGNNSLDTSFAVAETMVYRAGTQKPDCIILPESALLCYLNHRSALSGRVIHWRDSVRAPMFVGALDWTRPSTRSYYEYWVYNTAFFLGRDAQVLRPYYKIKLVPFSEAMPFEARIPLLSRVNLGEADFHAGADPAVVDVAPGVRAGPLICYEIIYTDFVRRRVRSGANLLVNITNDGWFGHSAAPFQHAAMARMRCIENGVALARCANSGISEFVDAKGRVLSKTRLYTRTVLTDTLPLARIHTIYSRAGDWPVWLSMIVAVLALGVGMYRQHRKHNKIIENHVF
jgi:apolipoprotein N-acyltransferase